MQQMWRKNKRMSLMCVFFLFLLPSHIANEIHWFEDDGCWGDWIESRWFWLIRHYYQLLLLVQYVCVVGRRLLLHYTSPSSFCLNGSTGIVKHRHRRYHRCCVLCLALLSLTPSWKASSFYVLPLPRSNHWTRRLFYYYYIISNSK